MSEKKFNQVEYMNEFKRKNYDRIEVNVPKGTKETLKAKAKERGMSLNEFINEAIRSFQ